MFLTFTLSKYTPLHLEAINQNPIPCEFSLTPSLEIFSRFKLVILPEKLFNIDFQEVFILRIVLPFQFMCPEKFMSELSSMLVKSKSELRVIVPLTLFFKKSLNS